MANLLTKTASDLENGLYVQASRNYTRNVISIIAANHKARKERTTDLKITLPPLVANVIPHYWVVDHDHANLFDSPTADDWRTQTVTPPTISGGVITLTMQPRSVHLLEFIVPTPSVNLTMRPH